MLEILLGRLSKSLYNQALKKIAKFVRTNILPAAIAEVGLLCCACVHTNPEEAVSALVEPMLSAVISSLKGTPATGFGGRGVLETSVLSKAKPTLSPALETSIDCQLKILSVAINYGGPVLLRYSNQFLEAVASAFESPSWKVNGAGDHLLRSLIGSLVLYYPVDQYRCILSHPAARALEEWIGTKDYGDEDSSIAPKWHVPNDTEVQFANELLNLHLKSALDDLMRICRDRIHSDPGNEKLHLKVTLLRIDSSLQGVLSCLPDFSPASRNGIVNDPSYIPFLIAGATGTTVGSSELRENAAEIVHYACKYLLEEKSDDSILLVLIVRIIDALINYGSLEFDEWSNHRQAWKLESSAIIEPPINFIVSSHSKGKKRPRWALIDKAYMHNTWRTSQSTYHLFRTSGSFSPSEHAIVLMNDLLNLCLHSYETVRGLAGKSLLKMIKRWPSLISKCVLSLTENLRNPAAPEYAVLGSCAVLSTQTVLKHLTTDPKTFSSFLLSILSSSHHESLKTQKAINEISALNTLLKESPYKVSAEDQGALLEDLRTNVKSSLEGALSEIFQEEGFFNETLNSLSHVHIITDSDGSSRGNHGNSSFQSLADKSITRFYFDFSSSWPRTPSWISLLGVDNFYSSFARIFKRLVQECGMPILLALKTPLEDFANATERSKQCVAAEAFAGVLHSDVDGVLGAWDSWMMGQLQSIVLGQSVESIPEWSACIRYAVTGKGKYGTNVPLLRQQILDCLITPLSTAATTTVVAKRYTFLSAALIEICPQKMPVTELEIHNKLLNELLANMCHSSAQVREAIGINLSILCSNIRLRLSFSNEGADHGNDNPNKTETWVAFLTERASEMVTSIQNTSQSDNMETAAHSSVEYGTTLNGDIRDDVKWMETLFHFIVSTLKSGRSSCLVDVIVRFIYPVIALQETSNKDLSTLAKAAFELLKWRIFWEPHLQRVVEVILSSSTDSNWRTRSATLTYLRTFMYRHTYILPKAEKQKIWRTVENLLRDNQVREHAAAVLAGLMKGGDEDLACDFRERALVEASTMQRKRKQQRNLRSGQPLSSIHGAVLALTASVLSVPYDMPSWLPEHVTLLARFAAEPSPIKSTVTKAVAEFRRTHADTWNFQKDSFTEEQLEVLADTSSSSSYFA
ncbi:unnamed protein product [Linum tenue]|uniref:Proteasome activator complex subunit 4 C-terminal domain-containing protein n=1 Tax=Linum tenue TaxID=586396 RepID=A0AAV0IHC7_9ROSI|nr:unnamed protein product [Linum tenue]